MSTRRTSPSSRLSPTPSYSSLSGREPKFQRNFQGPSLSGPSPSISSRSVVSHWHTPCPPLEHSPLDIICSHFNVDKLVPLELGVPPPLSYDITIKHGANPNTSTLFPTHILAAFDHDLDPFSGSQCPVTLIPVNVDVWSRCVEKQIGGNYNTALLAPYDARTLQTSLTLPIVLFPIPHAATLPLLLVSALCILPPNRIASALLPSLVLAELPANPAIVAGVLAHRPDTAAPSRTHRMPSRAPRHPSDRDRTKDRSRDRQRERGRDRSKRRDDPPSTPTVPTHAQASAEAEADSQLMRLHAHNYGMWTNLLSIGVRDQELNDLVDVAWTVTAEAYHLRFGNVAQTQPASGSAIALGPGRTSADVPPTPLLQPPSFPDRS